MIDIRKLKELVRLMVNHDLTEVDLRDAEEQVTLRRNSGMTSPVVSHHAAMAPNAPIAAGTPAPAATIMPQASNADSETAPAGEDSGLTRIESPMVGTFYTKPNPDSPAFVSVGASVGPDTVVCLIEAMKIFNEIKAECSGTIHKVLVSNGQAVEFGQPLFLIKPD